MRAGLLTIFARVPTPGRVKTRLTPPLDPNDATRLYVAFLCDLIHRLGNAPGFDLEFCVAGEGGEVNTFFEIADQCIPPVDRSAIGLQTQHGTGLGERLANSFRDSFSAGRSKTVILGADHPSVPVDYVNLAFDLLDDADVVIGPSDDGGFYAIGLTRDIDGLLDELPWSTPELFETTVARFERLGLRYAQLPPWYDVDRIEDVFRLVEDIESGIDLPATSRAIAGIGIVTETMRRGEGV